MKKSKKISIIIPTLNGESTIGKLIESLKKQTIKPYEFIVIDSGSTDKTIEILKKQGIMPLSIKKQDFNHGKTRNKGASIAKGDFLVFMTQDAIAYDEYLIENLLKPLENSNNMCVASYARHIPYKGASPIEKFLRNFNYPPFKIIKSKKDVEKMGIKTYFFSNVCSAIIKDVFEEVGGFPENIPINEDMFFAYRLINKGYKICYEPKAKVYHSHNLSYLKKFLRYYNIGKSLGITKLYKEVKYNGEGFKYLKEGLKFFVKEKEFLYIILFFSEVFIKYIAFHIGILSEINKNNK